MNPQLIIQTTIGILVLLGYIFFIYNYFKNPQVSLDKQQDLDKANVDSKALLLEKQATWDRENNEKKFQDMGTRMDRAMALAENHTHTVDVKVDALITSVNSMNLQLTNEVTRLRTTIEERLPKRT